MTREEAKAMILAEAEKILKLEAQFGRLRGFARGLNEAGFIANVKVDVEILDLNHQPIPETPPRVPFWLRAFRFAKLDGG